MINSSSQTDQTIDSKSQIYDKISDHKRTSLIQMLQEKRTTLKEVATSLQINYSTAKTIIQTFRKEKRIIKRPKFNIVSKRAEKRMHKLTKSLMSQPIEDIISEINDSETISTSELHTCQDKCIHKVISANTLNITDLREEIFGCNMQNKEMQTEVMTKPVFGLIRNVELKNDVDYNDVLLLRKRVKLLPPVDSYLTSSKKICSIDENDKHILLGGLVSVGEFNRILRSFYNRKRKGVLIDSHN